MNRGELVLDYLRSRRCDLEPVIATDGRAIVFDLSSGSRIQGIDITTLDVEALSKLINAELEAAGTGFAFGRYGEPRELYDNENFIDAESGEARTIHLGVDLFCAAGTPVATPLDGTIELVESNDMDLGYGPMVVIRHEVGDDRFYTLYGHLGADTFDLAHAGQSVAAGKQIATVGAPPTNGNWPPHLHMQLIVDLNGLGSDFPGVATSSRKEYWIGLSPSPAVFFPEIDKSLLEYQ